MRLWLKINNSIEKKGKYLGAGLDIFIFYFGEGPRGRYLIVEIMIEMSQTKT